MVHHRTLTILVVLLFTAGCIGVTDPNQTTQNATNQTQMTQSPVDQDIVNNSKFGSRLKTAIEDHENTDHTHALPVDVVLQNTTTDYNTTLSEIEAHNVRVNTTISTTETIRASGKPHDLNNASALEDIRKITLVTNTSS